MLGRKTGGRQRGTPNKKTAARKAQEAAIAAEIEDARSRGLEPLDYMLSVKRDVTADVTRRDAMAKAAAPYDPAFDAALALSHERRRCC